jgi:hypothetical protein
MGRAWTLVWFSGASGDVGCLNKRAEMYKQTRDWLKAGGAIGCHPNNNTAIFPTASHGFAAHVDLLRRFCGTQGRCTINRLFGPSASYTAVVGDRAHYAAFVSRMSGVPVDKVFDPNDAGVMGRIATSSACNEGGGFPWTPREIAQGLTEVIRDRRL